MKKWFDKIRGVRKPHEDVVLRVSDETPLPPVFAKMLQVHIMETTNKR